MERIEKERHKEEVNRLLRNMRKRKNMEVIKMTKEGGNKIRRQG